MSNTHKSSLVKKNMKLEYFTVLARTHENKNICILYIYAYNFLQSYYVKEMEEKLMNLPKKGLALERLSEGLE